MQAEMIPPTSCQPNADEQMAFHHYTIDKLKPTMNLIKFEYIIDGVNLTKAWDAFFYLNFHRIFARPIAIAIERPTNNNQCASRAVNRY